MDKGGQTYSYIFISLISVGISALLTKFVQDAANKFGWAQRPFRGRHIHSRPIPRLGGTAVFFTFVGVCLFYSQMARWGLVPSLGLSRLLPMLLPAFAVFAIGLFDDFRSVQPKTKLYVQIAAGVSLYFAGFNFAFLQAATSSAWLNTAIGVSVTTFWVVLVCNAINLIDGLDGLASGAALFSMVTIFTVAVVDGNAGVALATAVLGGSLLGFLSFNFNPASIFLGDSGSLFVGFVMSGLVLAESTHRPTLARSIAMPIIALALPLIDTFLTVVRRFLSGRALFVADREHIHHKLLDSGLTHRQVVMTLYGVSAGCVVLSLFLIQHSDSLLIPVVGLLLIVLFFGLRRLDYREFGEFRRVWRRVWQQKQVFARNIAVRKAVVKLQSTERQEGMVHLLESCLCHDFDGFEIDLDRELLEAEGVERFWTSPIGSFWRNGYDEKVVFVLELSTSRHGLIGRLLLHRGAGRGWLVDTDLLATELRGSLSQAIENCVFSHKGEFIADLQPEPGSQDSTTITKSAKSGAPTARLLRPF